MSLLRRSNLIVTRSQRFRRTKICQAELVSASKFDEMPNQVRHDSHTSLRGVAKGDEEVIYVIASVAKQSHQL